MRALIFIHGFLGSKHDWDEIIDFFSADFICLSFDLPGHGSCDISNQENLFPSTAKMIDQFLERKKINQAIFIGYSLGGRVALYFQHHYPQKVLSSILLSCNLGLKSRSAKKVRFAWDLEWARSLKEEPFDKFLQKWYDQPLFKNLKAHKDFPKLLERREKNDPQKLAQALVGLSLSRQPYLVKSITASTSLLCGELDRKYVDYYRGLNLSFHPIKNCSHAPHLEDPVQFTTLLKTLLEKTIRRKKHDKL